MTICLINFNLQDLRQFNCPRFLECVCLLILELLWIMWGGSPSRCHQTGLITGSVLSVYWEQRSSTVSSWHTFIACPISNEGKLTSSYVGTRGCSLSSLKSLLWNWLLGFIIHRVRDLFGKHTHTLRKCVNIEKERDYTCFVWSWVLNVFLIHYT